MMEIIGVNTGKDTQFVDITGEVQGVLNRANIKEGVVNVFTKHTTTAITINENESLLLNDFEKALDNLVPKGAGYGHDAIDSNAHAHIRSILLGASETISVREGKLQLGTWQKIFLVEFECCCAGYWLGILKMKAWKIGATIGYIIDKRKTKVSRGEIE